MMMMMMMMMGLAAFHNLLSPKGAGCTDPARLR